MSIKGLILLRMGSKIIVLLPVSPFFGHFSLNPIAQAVKLKSWKQFCCRWHCVTPLGWRLQVISEAIEQILH